MKKYYLYAAAAVSITTLALPLITNAQYSKGLNPPTTQDQAWADQNMVNTGEVLLNKIGLERVNAERKAKGLPPLDIKPVEIGQEVVPGTVRVRTSATSSNITPGRPLPPMVRQEIEMMRASSTMPIRQEIRDDIMNWREGSSTRPLPLFLTPLLKRLASTTMMDKEALKDRLAEYRQDRKEARLDIFAAKQNFLVEQLTRALDNLKQIRERISSRIDKAASEGRDMTSAKSLLVTADASITAAGTAIQALADYTPPAAAMVNVQASTTVELTRPRIIGADAIKAVTDARKALNEVVRAIAQAMGLKIGQQNSTSTAPTTTQ